MESANTPSPACPTEPGGIATGDAAFNALLTPHRSLSPHGFLVLMLAIGSVSFGTGIVFLLSGAWPVLAFCGLDVLLVYIAFKLNYRAARLHETVHLTPEQLVVKRIHPTGQEEIWQFNPYWVRLVVEEADETNHAELILRSHGRELVFGRFLSNEEKVDFAQALSDALTATRAAVRPA
jgi:uncharacterized membrane protein